MILNWKPCVGIKLGMSLRKIGEELGVSAHLLGRWRRQMQTDGEKAAFPGHCNPSDEEPPTLKRALPRVRKERDSFAHRLWARLRSEVFSKSAMLCLKAQKLPN